MASARGDLLAELERGAREGPGGKSEVGTCNKYSKGILLTAYELQPYKKYFRTYIIPNDPTK